MFDLFKKIHLILYRIKKCIFNKNYYYYMFKRISKPGLIDTQYKKNVCSLYNYSPSIIKWFEDEAYDKLIDYPLSSTSVVMDVGGYKGKWTEKIYQRYKCNVIIYEPVIEYFAIIMFTYLFNPAFFRFASKFHVHNSH